MNTKRASRPFELVHSDLKSFPIESYHRFKYVIVFFDDYTSNAWTVKLHTKDGVLTATSQFLALVETKYNAKVVQWMSDAGGEYKSKAFDKMLKDRGIEILQSIPYAHQQNGRAERIICTLMEKAESMRLQACLPQSWWEFSVEHATHVYNQTPLRRLNWQTPYQLLNNERPSVQHLQVFGCGAYVYIPAETRANKLAPKSELMVYLGNAPGANGFTFMRSPNNVLYYATHCIFDELLFPRCKALEKWPNTRVHEQPPVYHHHQHHSNDLDDEESTPPLRVPVRQQLPAPMAPPQEEVPLPPPRTPSPVRQAPQPAPPPAPRPQRVRKVPVRPGNVYGETRHPVEILKGAGKKKGGRQAKGAVPRTAENNPLPDVPVPGPSTPARQESVPLPPISPTTSELEIE